MDLKNLRAEQQSAIKWSEGVRSFWSGFEAEIKSIDKFIGDSTGIQLHWRLPRDGSPDLGLLQGLEWRFPEGTRYAGRAYVGVFMVHVEGLPRALELQLLSFTIVSDSTGNLALRVFEHSKDYCATVERLALPLRLHSYSPPFDSLFLWSSAIDNEKIADRLTVWLAGKDYGSEFKLETPQESGCGLSVCVVVLILALILYLFTAAEGWH